MNSNEALIFNLLKSLNINFFLSTLKLSFVCLFNSFLRILFALGTSGYSRWPLDFPGLSQGL